MKRIIALTSVLVLWSLSVVVFANGIDPMGGATHDVAIKYLGQIFGYMPGTALSHDHVGIMGQLFRVFNQGVMVVAAVWLTYSITQITMSCALTSQGFQKFSVSMIAFRVCVGMAFLVPNPHSGYSMVQTLMMNVVVEGSKLADSTWSYALDYMQNGGLVYDHKPSNGAFKQTDVNKYMPSQSELSGPVAKILQNEICMFASSHYYIENPDQLPSQLGKGLSFHIAPNASQQIINFPGIGDTPGQGGHGCGSVTIDRAIAGQGLPDPQVVYDESYSAMFDMVNQLLPLAQRLAAGTYTDQGNVIQHVSPEFGADKMKRAIIKHFMAMKPAVQARAKFLGDNSYDGTFFDQAKEQGWFNAGSFYWNLSRWNDMVDVHFDPSSYLPLTTSYLKNNSMVAEVANSVQLAGAHLMNDGVWGAGYAEIMQYATNQQRQQQQPSDTVQKGNIYPFVPGHSADDAYDAGFADNSNLGINIFGPDNGRLKNTVNAILNTFNSIMMGQQSDSYDPLVFVQTVGKTCLQQAGQLWTTSLSAAVSLGHEAMGCSAFFGSCAALGATLAWVVPMWCAIAGMLFTAGFMLNFYTPLYPYLLFMFGALGWLLSVIEAMAAAPLVAFGMTHPEGHDFLGKAEQALMLALGVFIRPALMVIGFVAGMLMSYVAFNFVNTVIGRVFISAFNPGVAGSNQAGPQNVAPLDAVWEVVAGGSASQTPQTQSYTGNPFADFMLIPLLLVAYGMIVIEVVNQCFSAIHQVPDMVLRWIGGPQLGDQSEKYVQSIKQGMQSSAQQAGKIAGDAATGKGKAIFENSQQQGQMINKVASAGVGAMIDKE